jgi:cytochrome c-type biogenesis protein CcmE
MTDLAWEKPKGHTNPIGLKRESLRFLLGGLLLIGAVIYLIFSGTSAGARYFITVDEVVKDSQYIGQTVRLSGAVIGDTIKYDAPNLLIDFTVAHIPTETDDLALTLHQAVSNPNATQLKVHLENQVKPDLLQHESQAIITGRMGEDGVFYATELLLKCPSRYEEDVPNQALQGNLQTN